MLLFKKINSILTIESQFLKEYEGRMKSNITFILCLTAVFAACSNSGKKLKSKAGNQEVQTDSVSNEGQQFVEVENPNPSDGEVAIPVSIGASEYTAAIDNCLSGFEKQISQDDSDIFIQANDQNCRFRLLRLVFEEESFDFTGIENWDQGSKFIVRGDQGTNLTVFVEQTLSELIGDAETIVINLIESSDNQFFSYTPRTPLSVNIDVSESKLPFSLNSFDVGVADSGAGMFEFYFGCFDELGCIEAMPKPVYVNLLRVPEGFIPTYDTCNSILSSGLVADNFVNPGDEVLVNGGLVTYPIEGPGRLFDPANSQLVMTIGDPNFGGSCEFYFISVTD